jgi:uncharacterized protein (TIGR00730 family)
MTKRQRPTKAYKNITFLNSSEARTIRILSEYYEPLARFKKHKIKNSIVFFGSSRAMDPAKADKSSQTSHQKELSKYYQDAVDLSRKLTEWSITRESGKQHYYICSGGGPGIMEAANKGAQLAGGKSIGLNISIPMEQYPNSYITEDLMFEFHYFFIRKFWFMYLAKALVIFPGGFGTLDELFEAMTLIQTGKVSKSLPIVIYGNDYWRHVINFDTMVEWGTIYKEEKQLLYFSDDVEDTYRYLISSMDDKN